jgi:hypothetical protein
MTCHPWQCGKTPLRIDAPRGKAAAIKANLTANAYAMPKTIKGAWPRFKPVIAHHKLLPLRSDLNNYAVYQDEIVQKSK